MGFEITILGSGSATPAYNRHSSAQVINIRERFFLVDCGEGTQMQLMYYKIKYHRINHVFISHLHGDHYLGLMGLIFTMHLNGRTNEMHVYGQQELMNLIDMQLQMSNTELKYNLIFHAVQYFGSKIIYEDDEVQVKSIVLNHRIPTTGFIFREKPKPPHLNPEKAKQYGIPYSFYNRIKAGESYIDDSGNQISLSELTEPADLPRSYAYCSDTKYDERLVYEIKNVDVLYHEATFLEELAQRANDTYHSTAKQAAIIAKKGNVKKLLLGHFSSRYKELNDHLIEAKEIFGNTELAIEGVKFCIEATKSC